MADRFLEIVQARAGDVDSEQEARRAAQAVLEVLGRQLTGPAVRELADGLPAPASTFLANAGEEDGTGMDAAAFHRAVGQREGLSETELEDEATIAAHIQAVFAAVGELAPRDAVDSAREQLNAELRRLWLPADEDEVAASLPEPRPDERTT